MGWFEEIVSGEEQKADSPTVPLWRTVLQAAMPWNQPGLRSLDFRGAAIEGGPLTNSEPPRMWYENLADAFAPDPNAVLMGDPSGPGMAIIPTAKNLSVFINRMRAAQPINIAKQGLFTAVPKAEEAEKADLALRYLQARYKTLGEIAAEKAVVESNPFATLFGVAGSFDPKQTGIKLQSQQLFSKPGAGNFASTLGHEATHARDYTRAARTGANLAGEQVRVGAVSPEEFVPVSEGGKYVPPTGPGGIVAYKAQPVEARAFRAGESTEQGYQSFLKLVEQKASQEGLLPPVRKNPNINESRVFRHPESIARLKQAVLDEIEVKFAGDPKGLEDQRAYAEVLFSEAGERAKAAREWTRSRIDYNRQIQEYRDRQNAYERAVEERRRLPLEQRGPWPDYPNYPAPPSSWTEYKSPPSLWRIMAEGTAAGTPVDPALRRMGYTTRTVLGRFEDINSGGLNPESILMRYVKEPIVPDKTDTDALLRLTGIGRRPGGP